MAYALRLVRFGNWILSAIAAILVIALLSFGGYELWYDWSVAQGAFLSDDLMQYKPAASEDGSNPTLEELMAINEDVVGWLTVDDTNIDYPVVQGENDMEYVNKDVYGDFALSGAIFLSCLNSSDFSDPYNLVYGHHMANGAMFGDLENFSDADYFSEHQTGTLYLLDRTVEITFFCCLITDAYDDMIFQVATDDGNAERLEYLAHNATQYRDIGLQVGDQLIALSTCLDTNTNGRLILIGKMAD